MNISGKWEMFVKNESFGFIIFNEKEQELNIFIYIYIYIHKYVQFLFFFIKYLTNISHLPAMLYM